jgi:hypothetical protein
MTRHITSANSPVSLWFNFGSLVRRTVKLLSADAATEVTLAALGHQKNAIRYSSRHWLMD